MENGYKFDFYVNIWYNGNEDLYKTAFRVFRKVNYPSEEYENIFYRRIKKWKRKW